MVFFRATRGMSWVPTEDTWKYVTHSLYVCIHTERKGTTKNYLAYINLISHFSFLPRVVQTAHSHMSALALLLSCFVEIRRFFYFILPAPAYCLVCAFVLMPLFYSLKRGFALTVLKYLQLPREDSDIIYLTLDTFTVHGTDYSYAFVERMRCQQWKKNTHTLHFNSENSTLFYFQLSFCRLDWIYCCFKLDGNAIPFQVYLPNTAKLWLH